MKGQSAMRFATADNCMMMAMMRMFGMGMMMCTQKRSSLCFTAV